MFKNYTVSISPKFPAAGFPPTDYMDFTAKNKADAIKQARKHMRDEAGWNTKYDGPISYKAELAE